MSNKALKDDKQSTLNTPVQQKRTRTLGLRYSAFKNISKTPLSEIKQINQLNKTFPTETSSPRTPLATNTENSITQSKSTGQIPSNKLSFSRKNIKKKRLQFVDSNSSSKRVKNTKTEEHKDHKSDTKKSVEINSDDNENKEVFNNPEDEKHIKKVEELKELIEIWKNGFERALDDLSQRIDPPREKSEILELLNISNEMIKYA